MDWFQRSHYHCMRGRIYLFFEEENQAVMGKSSSVSSCVYICEISQLMLWSHFMYTHINVSLTCIKFFELYLWCKLVSFPFQYCGIFLKNKNEWYQSCHTHQTWFACILYQPLLAWIFWADSIWFNFLTPMVNNY